MNVRSDATPTVQGHPLVTDGAPLGEFRRTAAGAPAEALRAGMAEDGYLYLPGFLDRDEVFAVRRELTQRLAGLGVLAAGTDPMDAIVAPAGTFPAIEDLHRQLVVDNDVLRDLIYGKTMMALFQRLLGGSVVHFDFTWMRVTSPGHGTPAHTDIVFMGRGTPRLYTAWVPYGDVPLELGGLAILEHGHRSEMIHTDYAVHDVDTYCENTDEVPTVGPDPGRSLLDADPLHLREVIGGRWLTTSYRAGDVVIFGMFTPHVGIDNATSDRVRLSSDSRYQLAGEPVDERWVGADPIGHGVNAKRGLIC